MIIGNGLLAKAFNTYQHDQEKLIFASGVSNSTNIVQSVFEREKTLLLTEIEKNLNKVFVYFSTCSVYDFQMLNTPYVQHKLAMEELIMHNHPNYHIFRMSNLAGRTHNPHTVLNFFFQNITKGIFFYLWDNTSRNIIDAGDAFLICDLIMKKRLYKNQVVNIANPVNYSVSSIVETIEVLANKRANYKIISKDSNPKINISSIKKIIHDVNINFDDQYLEKIVRKYFFQKNPLPV